MRYKALFLGSFLGLLSFIGGSSASAQMVTISGTGVSNITESAATINWTTSTSSDSQVFYGTTTAYGLSSTLQPATTTAHTVTLSSLTASTTYHFIVRSQDVAGNLATSTDQTFSTLVAPVIPPGATTTADILAKVKIEPRTLNTRSRGKWIEAEMTFPSNGYTAANINKSSIKLNDTLSPDRVKVKSKHRGRTIAVEMKFPRQALVDLLAGTATSTQATATTTPTVLMPSYQSVNVTIGGFIGTKTFGGSTTLRLMTWTPQPVPAPVIKKEKHKEEREKERDISHSSRIILQQTASTTQTIVVPTIKNVMKLEKEKKEKKEKNEEKSKKQEDRGKEHRR